jgi:hypothetical protein
MAQLSIRLLGPFQVTVAGEPATGFATDKARALLAYLVVEAGRPHRREALAGLQPLASMWKLGFRRIRWRTKAPLID